MTLSAALFASGAAVAAPDDALPLGPGSVVYWTSVYDGGSDEYREALLAEGEDFALYQMVSEWAEGGAGDYFALFSGIYYAPCEDEMPSAEEREAIAGLYPLSPGAKVAIGGDQGPTFTIGEATEFFLMGRPRAAHKIDVTYAGDDPSEESITVLDDMPLTVAIQWSDGARDSASLVTSPKSVASTPVDTDLIGNCASLMNIQTNEN